jgi:hypothetical protein
MAGLCCNGLNVYTLSNDTGISSQRHNRDGFESEMKCSIPRTKRFVSMYTLIVAPIRLSAKWCEKILIPTHIAPRRAGTAYRILQEIYDSKLCCNVGFLSSHSLSHVDLFSRFLST